MNGRKLFREYVRYKGKEAKEFDRKVPQFYNQDTLVTLDSEN